MITFNFSFPEGALYSMGVAVATGVVIFLLAKLMTATKFAALVGPAIAYSVLGFAGMTRHVLALLVFLLWCAVLGLLAGLIFPIWWVGLIVGCVLSVLVGVIGNNIG